MSQKWISRESCFEDRHNLCTFTLATDCHLGYSEKDQVRGNDSLSTFEEILQIAKDKKVGTYNNCFPWLKKIIWVIGVLRRTDVSDWRFDNLCRSHLQSQVVVLVSWKLFRWKWFQLKIIWAHSLSEIFWNLDAQRFHLVQLGGIWRVKIVFHLHN